MRSPIRALAAAILLAGPTVLAFASGGFFDRPRLIAAVGAWLLVAVAMLVSPCPLPRSRAGIAAVAGLALLALWTLLSYRWAPLGERAQADAQRLTLYLGVLVAGAALLRGRAASWVEPVLALGTVVVTGYGLSARLLPGLVELDRSRSGAGRLEQPLTYWNAMGCLAAIGFVLCVRVATDPRRPRWLRAGAGAASPVVAAGVYLSLSRGALLALAVGLLMLFLLAPERRNLTRVGGALVLLGTAVSLVASRLPDVDTLAPSQTADAGQGAAMLAALVVAAAVAGVIGFRSPAPELGEPAEGPMRLAPRPRLVAVALAVVVIAAAAGVAAFEGTPKNASDGSVSASRFRSADSLRYSYWDTALTAFADHPLAGTGTGGFAVEWRRRPNRPEPAVDAHSLYVETLSELGLVGALFLALFLGGVGAAAAGLYRRAPALAAGPTAAMVVWLVHAGLDWDWEMPALTGVALLLAAATLAAHDEGRDRPPPHPGSDPAPGAPA